MGIFNNHKVHKAEEQLIQMGYNYACLEEKYLECKNIITSLSEEKENFVQEIQHIRQDNMYLQARIEELEQVNKILQENIEELSIINRELKCNLEEYEFKFLEVENNYSTQANQGEIIERKKLIKKFIGLIDLYRTNNFIRDKHNLLCHDVYQIDSENDTYIEQIFKLQLTTGGYEITDYIGFDEKYITIPEIYKGKPIISLKKNLFNECELLESVSIKANLERLPIGTFKYCINLWQVNLPETLKVIESEVFFGCLHLNFLNIPKSIKHIGAAFSCSEIKEVNLPEGIEEIEDNTFCSCTNLEKIDIPTSVKIIGESAFSRCSSLNVVILKEGIERIEREAFCDCPQIEEITIPKSVTYIGPEVFAISKIYRPDLRYNPRKVYLGNDKIIIKCWPGTYAQTFFRGKYRCNKAKQIEKINQIGSVTKIKS